MPAEAPEPPCFRRDCCVKGREGKGAEFAEYLRAGKSARGGYHLVSGSIGFPPEVPSAEQTAADLKKAGIVSR